MSKGFNKILDFMKLNDNEYDDDYEYDDEIDDDIEDEVEEEPVKKKRTTTKTTSRFKKPSASKSNDDYDDIEDNDDDVSEKRKTRTESTTRKSTTFGRNNKIVPMRPVSSRSMEVCVSKPVDFNTCQEISDIILSGRAAIINFDGVTTQEAQRIIDFVSGSCYAINGSAKQISDSIVVVTPEDIDITGDLQEMASSNVDIPAFGYSEEDE